jgi:hypothetical protein
MQCLSLPVLFHGYLASGRPPIVSNILRLAAAAEEAGPHAPHFQAAIQPGRPHNCRQKVRGAINYHQLKCSAARPCCCGLPAGLHAEPAPPAAAAGQEHRAHQAWPPPRRRPRHPLPFILLGVPVTGLCKVLGSSKGPHLLAASHHVFSMLLMCMPCAATAWRLGVYSRPQHAQHTQSGSTDDHVWLASPSACSREGARAASARRCGAHGSAQANCRCPSPPPRAGRPPLHRCRIAT